MPRYAANLSMMYAVYPFIDRFQAAAKNGFDAVEYLLPCEYPASALALALAELLKTPGLAQVLFNAPSGDWSARERGALRTTWVGNLAWAAERAVGASVDVLMEPINTREIPGFFLNRQDEAHALRAEVGAPNIAVQMNLYHCQIVEGDVAMKLRHCSPTGRVGHLQIAGVPERHEPDLGELRFDCLAGVIDELGCDGRVGCEYRPEGSTSAGLGW